MRSHPPRRPSIGLLRQFTALPGGKRVLTSGISLAGLLFGAVIVNAYVGVRSYRDLDKKFERLEDQMKQYQKQMERYHRENQQDRKDSEARLERLIHMMFSKQVQEVRKEERDGKP